MKRLVVITVALAMVLVMAGCSSVSQLLSATKSASNAGALPAAAQLAVGTLKLEAASQGLTATQATDLLPLWKAYRSLSQSSSASTVETDALVRQIKGTLTVEQVAAITAMKLTADDAQSAIQEQGAAQAQGTTANSSSGTSAASQAARSTSGTGSTAQGGGMPAGAGGGMPSGGGMPAGGGGDMGGDVTGGQPPEQAASTTAQAKTTSNTVSVVLINAVINLLESKA